MVQISTVHDTELNQKVFRVRGDEGYLMESKVAIAEVDDSIASHGANYDVEITVTLQRGKGASFIAIINNGVTINVVEWASDDTTKTVLIEGLTYEIDNNIQVKWLGNSRCLKSTSNTLVVNKENETYRSTAISLTTTGNMVDVNDGGVVGFILEDVEDEDNILPISNGTIKVYVDGNYKGTATTNSDGEASYNFGTGDGLEHGIRKITLFYDGGAVEQAYYRSSEEEFDYSIGKKISVTNYPTVFLNGSDYAQNNITAIVTDYFNNPLNGISVSLNDDSATGTTNSSGSVTLCPSSITNNTSYYLKSGSSETDSYTFKSATITGIDISSPKTMITPNTNVQMTVQVTGTDIQKDIAVRVNNSETMYTNDSGKFTISYTGIGYGDRVYDVACADATDSITIEDLFFYYGTEIPNYAPMKTFVGSYTKQSNGLKINMSNDGTRTRIGMGDANNQVGDWQMTFKVVYHDWNSSSSPPSGYSRGTALMFGSWKSSGYTDPTNANNRNVIGMAYNGQTAQFRITKENGEISIYKKYPSESGYSFVITYHNPTSDNPMFMANAYYNKNVKLIINNIKIKRINRS